MSNFGIRASKEGFDEDIAIGDDVLIDTDLKNLKYVRNVRFTEAGQYAHNLGFSPLCWTWSQDADGWWTKHNASSDDTYIYSGVGYAEYLADRGFTDISGAMDSDVGVRISVEGVDEKEASPYDLVFSSAFNAYKVFKRGQMTFSWATDEDGEKSVYYTHNTGYAPKFFLFGEDGQEPKFTSSGYAGEEIYTSYTNTTQLKLTGSRADMYGMGLPAVTRTFTYFIFVDQIDDDDFI